MLSLTLTFSPQAALASVFKASLPPLSDSAITELAHAAPSSTWEAAGASTLVLSGRGLHPCPQQFILPWAPGVSFQAAQSPGKARLGVDPSAFLQRLCLTWAGRLPLQTDDTALRLHFEGVSASSSL